jgi:hypothetical protein
MLKKAWEWIVGHPYIAGGIFVGVLVLMWWSGRGSGQNTGSTSTDTVSQAYYSAEAAAAQASAAQNIATINANATTAQTQIAADASTAQTVSTNTSAVSITGINAGAQTDQATLAAKSLFATGAINSLLGYASLPSSQTSSTDGGSGGSSSGKSSSAVSYNGPGSPIDTNYKPWLTIMAETLFGNANPAANLPGQYLGAAGSSTGDVAWAKYLGWIGGAQIGGLPSVDQLSNNPASINFTPPATPGSKAPHHQRNSG